MDIEISSFITMKGISLFLPLQNTTTSKQLQSYHNNNNDNSQH